MWTPSKCAQIFSEVICGQPLVASNTTHLSEFLPEHSSHLHWVQTWPCGLLQSMGHWQAWWSKQKLVKHLTPLLGARTKLRLDSWRTRGHMERSTDRGELILDAPGQDQLQLNANVSDLGYVIWSRRTVQLSPVNSQDCEKQEISFVLSQ